MTSNNYQSAGEGLFFKRGDDGTVIVLVENTTFTIDSGIWGSLVLNMTKHGEQPNHWPVFMLHHLGKKNVIGYDAMAFDAYVAGYEFGRNETNRFEDLVSSFTRWFFGSWAIPK